MSSNFFSEALKQALTQRHFNQAQLAEFLHVDPAYISRWLKGSSPRIDQMRSVLTNLGWDLDRAHPDYDPFGDAIRTLEEGRAVIEPKKGKKSSQLGDAGEVRQLLADAAESHRRAQQRPVNMIGRLVAQKGLMEGVEPKEVVGLQTMDEVLKPLDYADNEMSVAEVVGNDFAPAYPQGSLVFLRRILKPGAVPDGTDVLFEALRKPGVLQLRRLVRISEGRSGRIDRVIGAPIAVGHNYLFYRPREVRLHSAIVGSLAVVKE
jgi:transcriptional regulator with XRE-family HTH domain